MAKDPNATTGVVIKPATGGGSSKPGGGKVRRFPWRLWLWALVMTAAAGAGGYFTWHYRSEAKTATEGEADARGKLSESESTLAVKDKALIDKTIEASDCAKQRTELDNTNKTLAGELATNQTQLTELAKVVEQNKAQLAAAKEFQQQFSKMIDSGAIKVSTRHGSLVLSLPAEVLFPSGVADLSDDGKVKVHEIGFTLKDKGPTNARYLVVGHSDNQPLTSSTYKNNWALSQARALTVTEELVRAGMAPKRLLPAGAGEHDPIAANDSVQNRARNRRIEIVLLPAITDLPDLPLETDKGKKPTKP